MKQLLEKLNGNKLKAVYVMTPLRLYEERRQFSPEPDLGIHSYEGTREKEYFVRTEIDLSKEYRYLLAATMKDYGYVTGDNLSDTLNSDGSGRLTLRLDDSSLRNIVLHLEGTINVSSYDFSNDDIEKIAQLELFGVKRETTLTLFEELLLEAYSLELEKNYRVSFFSYFAAIEAYVTLQLEPIKEKLHSELHFALERLELDNKLRIIFKSLGGNEDLNKIKLWSEFSGLFKKLKEKRNKIAHGQGVVDIKLADVQNIFLVACTLWSFAVNGHKGFDEIRQFIFPKQAKRR